MKNYILDGKDKDKYIKEVIDNKDGTISIIFADGKAFENVAYSKENMDKINEVLERQAKDGIANYDTFFLNESKSEAITALSTVFSFIAGTIATNHIDIDNPILDFAVIGAVSILGFIPAYLKLHKDKSKVKELDKLIFRDKHKQELESFRDYPNSLAGLYYDTKRWIKEQDDPFSIMNIDNYDKSDLETIVSNVSIEKDLGFTYKKR